MSMLKNINLRRIIMKKTNKIISALLSIVFIAAFSITSNDSIFVFKNLSISTNAETALSGIEYTVSNDTASITGYSGTSDIVTLPEKIDGYTVSGIQSYAFKNNNIIRKVYIESKITSLNASTFLNCSNLETVILPDTLNQINGSCFRNSNLAYITIPENVKIIHMNAFRGCSRLSTIDIKGTVDVRDSAFEGCTNLINVNIPLTASVKYTAFNNCKSLQYINNTQVIVIPPKEMYPFINRSLSNFIMQNLSGAENVGFFNTYTLEYAKKVVLNVTDSSMSDIQKAKALHDWLCNAVDYDDTNTKDAKNHVDYSAFLYSTTVCDGYARAYQHLMQAANIESYYIGSQTHAWNMIKLGNHYFHVDVTWDDGTGTGNYGYGYFLLSDNEIKAKGETVHASWGLITSPLFNYQYFWPWPSATYAMGDLNMDGTVDNQDVKILQDYILAKITLNSSQATLSDLNFDGQINGVDLSALRQKVLLQ